LTDLPATTHCPARDEELRRCFARAFREKRAPAKSTSSSVACHNHPIYQAQMHAGCALTLAGAALAEKPKIVLTRPLPEIIP